jgi:uracil-DNA glycosylase family 4
MESLWRQHTEMLVNCRKCPRLTAYREEVAQKKRRAYRDWDYWGKPVPGFGDPKAQVMVIGLAPGAHGSNRTGRMFTGDASGDFLYPALHRAGFASQPDAVRVGDGLQLKGMYISAVCRCAPPDNKPTPQEIENCLPYLAREIELLSGLQGFVALGRIAYDWLLRMYGATHHAREMGLVFAHGAAYLPGINSYWLVTSYHPSRQNTQTGRLTPAMFDEVWRKVRGLISGN